MVCAVARDRESGKAWPRKRNSGSTARIKRFESTGASAGRGGAGGSPDREGTDLRKGGSHGRSIRITCLFDSARKCLLASESLGRDQRRRTQLRPSSGASTLTVAQRPSVS